jgi:DNA-binding transcriptional ArsR family regulator/energy-coupling factor transporter ATP-binding protein EcfA2
MVELAVSAELARLPTSADDRERTALDLPDTLLVDLLLKHLLRAREATLAQLADRVGLLPTTLDRLLIALRELRAVEVLRRGTMDSQVTYALTDLGRQRAEDALKICQYTGIAPVSITQYRDRVRAQALDRIAVRPEQIRAALSDLVVSESLLDDLGAALNSGRATYLYGPSGSGKTSLAERMLRALAGTIMVPHAIWAGDQLITVFDPVVHRPVDVSASPTAPVRGLDRAARNDPRWIEIARPVVIAGGELTLDALELDYDQMTRVHGAPPQLKANGGLLIIDDLGRQRVSPRELMNRWIVPLDRRVDYLKLANGVRIDVPFDVRVVFSSNLAPEELADPAFMRRIGYKLYVGAMAESDYRTVMRVACERAGVAIDDALITYLVHELHARDQQELLPAFPFDLVAKVGDRARYRGEPMAMSRDQLSWAWQLYFGTGVIRDNSASSAKG